MHNIQKSLEEEEEKPFYEEKNTLKEEVPRMDQDHRLLLTNTKPLLQSRNAAVVLSVAQLYQHIAPKAEVGQVARALVRLLRSHREVQAVVLTNIASLSTQRKGMFEPFLKSFFVRSSDPTQIKILKLEVMTNIATETNIALILREFQTYIWSSDKEFVAATIQAIGRCASNIKEVTDSCLSGLVMLLSNKDELVVGESVVVVRKLLQSETVGHKDIITHMARLVDNIKMPTARASILWLLGEYCDKVPKIAPDVLRKMAKSFVTEADVVKLQIITLATKLYLTNPKQTHLLCQYVFNLAKYDTNYDIRDRARFIRALIFPAAEKESNKLARQAKKIFLASKPPPIQHSNFKDRDQFQLGTLSHLINARANGYCDLPPFPDVAPDPSVRNLKEDDTVMKKEPLWTKPSKSKKEKSFYSAEEGESSSGSDSEKDSESESDSESDSDTETDENDSSSSESEDDSSDESEDSDDGEELKKREHKAKKINANESSEMSSSESSSSSEADESSDSESSMSEKEMNGKMTNKNPSTTHQEKPKGKEEDKLPSKSDLDLLLDLDSVPLGIETPVLTPSLGGLLTPTVPQGASSLLPGASIKLAAPVFIPTAACEILNRISGNGLSVHSRFTRSPHLYSPSMTSIELAFKNNNNSEDIRDICVGAKRLSSGMAMHDFAVIPSLLPGTTLHGTLGVDFNDSITPANFDIVAGGKSFALSVTPNIGELIHPISMSESDFNHHQAKLRGMNEHCGNVGISSHLNNTRLLTDKLYQCANVLQVLSTDEKYLKFGGQTASSKSLVLVSIQEESSEEKIKVTVNCEKMIVASMLFKQLETAFSK